MKIPQTKRYSVYKNLVLQDERSYKLNFKPDGRKHYVYRLINLTLDTKENYYGSRSIPKNNPNKDIMENSWKYGTSSKKKKFILENKEIYKVKIVKIFDNPGDKICYEAFLHQYFDVKLHSRFWNGANQTPFGFDTTGTRRSKKMKEGQRISMLKKIEYKNIIMSKAKAGSIKGILTRSEILKKR